MDYLNALFEGEICPLWVVLMFGLLSSVNKKETELSTGTVILCSLGMAVIALLPQLPHGDGLYPEPCMSLADPVSPQFLLSRYLITATGKATNRSCSKNQTKLSLRLFCQRKLETWPPSHGDVTLASVWIAKEYRVV